MMGNKGMNMLIGFPLTVMVLLVLATGSAGVVGDQHATLEDELIERADIFINTSKTYLNESMYGKGVDSTVDTVISNLEHAEQDYDRWFTKDKVSSLQDMADEEVATFTDIMDELNQSKYPDEYDKLQEFQTDLETWSADWSDYEQVSGRTLSPSGDWLFLGIALGIGAFAVLIGIEVFGSGIANTSIRLMATVIMYLSVWIIFSSLTRDLILNMPSIGIPVWMILTLMYALGIFSSGTTAGIT